MEELTRLQASCKAVKGHITRLHYKMDELLTGDFDDYTISSLTTAIEQIKKKGDRIAQMDERIAVLTDNATELESAMYEAEALQDEIVEKIARAARYIELSKAKASRRSPTPLSETSQADPSQLQLDEATNVNVVEISPVSASSIVESGLMNTVTSAVQAETVSVTTASSDITLSVITSTTTPPAVINLVNYANTETCSTERVVPMTTMVYGTSLGPPPLIPADISSLVSQHRPTTLSSTLPAPRSFNELPINTQQQVLSNLVTNTPATLASRYLHESPLPVTQYSRAAPLMSTYPAVPSHHSQMFATSRLPKLTLPTFYGDPLTWQTFWDSFYVTIHANPNLSGVQKFNYLKAQLQADAARTIAGLLLTDANYHHAVAILVERYGQHHKIVNAHMQALLEMPSPLSNLVSLHTFYDTVESHIRGLSSLGKSEHSYGDLLVPIIMGKLPTDLQRNLAREHSNSPWNLPDLMAAILKEIRILESAPYDPHRSMPRLTTAAFHVASPGNRTRKQSNPDSSKKHTCVFCKKAHPAHNCDVVTDYQKRLDIVKENNLCFNCLAHHRVSQCPSKFRCRKCKKKHHTSLCSSEPTKPEESRPEKQTDSTTPTTTAGLLTPASCCKAPKNTACLLKTAVAPVIANGIKTHANILFDEGAQRSFISAELANKLHIFPTSQTDIAMASFGTTSMTHQKLGVTTIEIETLAGELISMSVLIVPSIAAPIQNSISTSVYNMPHIQHLKLAHPVTSEHNFAISLLIGADYYWNFVQDGIVRDDGPTAQQSRLGYLLSGPLPDILPDSTSSALLQITSTMPSEEPSLPNLEKFWSVEGIGTDTVTKSADLTFLKLYQESAISRTSEGTYVAKFPWKVDKPDLLSNFATCKGRTLTLVNKLRKSSKLLQLYDGIIKEQEQRGFIERVDDGDDAAATDVHYLPHHPVKKDSVTTPIRIVYDCSCRGNNRATSLNDCLTVGPPFLNNLCAILLRFRIHAFALSTDIEKAFLHIKLHPSDRNFTRFLWPLDFESSDTNFQTYRFTVVPFGASSSPFMLGAVLDLHLSKSHLQAAADMRDNMYVDNILSGCSTEEELLAYYSQSRDLMGQAKFNLRSWSTNSQRLQEVTRQDNSSDPNTTVGLLGLRWNTAADTISLSSRKLSAINTFVTKRDILQASSQIFDPLGWVTPVTVRAKILLQEVWLTKTTRDEPLPDTIKERWTAILADLRELPNILIPRLYFPPSQTGTHIDNIFVFADASTKAYGAIVYLNSGDHISFAMSKNRVAPTKPITLPRLELMAAVTATRLTDFVCSSIPHDRQRVRVNFWTDSQIVLYWILKGNNPKPFISHRVKEINEAFPTAIWSFTPSADNPADLLTRGLSADQLKSSRLCGHVALTGYLTNLHGLPGHLPVHFTYKQKKRPHLFL